MAWTTPTTVDAGEVLTADFWNEQVRDNFAVVRALANVKFDDLTTQFTTSSTTLTDITGLSVSITPTSTSSKILVTACVSAGMISGVGFLQLIRGSTEIAKGSGAPTNNTSALVYPNATQPCDVYTIRILDEPNTTSATTYKVQTKVNSGGQTIAINRPGVDAATAVYSSITVQEIPAAGF